MPFTKEKVFSDEKESEEKIGWIIRLIPSRKSGCIGETIDADTGPVFSCKHLDFTPEVGMKVHYKTMTSYTGVSQVLTAVDVEPGE